MDKKYFSEMKRKYETNGFDALIEYLSNVIKQINFSQTDAEELAKKFFEIIAGGGDYFDNSAGILFQEFHEKFPNSKKLRNNFSDVCDELKNNGILFPEVNISQKSKQFKIISRTQTYQISPILDKINEVVIHSFGLMSKVGNEWKEIEINHCNLQSGISSIIFYSNSNKEKIKLDNIKYYTDFYSVSSTLSKIKDEMYKQSQKEGGWIMCNMIVDKDKTYKISFNYDNIENFEKRAKNPVNLIREFESYPRSKDFTPEWWQEILGKKAKYIK